jgi:hypothetical protein
MDDPAALFDELSEPILRSIRDLGWTRATAQ